MDNKLLFRGMALGIINNQSVDLPMEADEQILQYIKSIPLSDSGIAIDYAKVGMEMYHLNVLPIHFLIHLSTLPDKTLFYKTFSSIIRNPEDLHYFISYLKNSDIREGTGRAVRNQVNKWIIENINSAWACQYRSKLNRISRTTHLRADIKELTKSVSHETNAYITHIQQNTGSFSRLEALTDVYADLNLDKVTERTLEIIKEEKVLWKELVHHMKNAGKETKMIIYGKALQNLTGLESIKDYSYLESLYTDFRNIPGEIIEHIKEQITLLDKPDLIPLHFLIPRLNHPEIRSMATEKARIEPQYDFYIDEKEWGRVPEEIQLILGQGDNIHDKSKLEYSENLLIITIDKAEAYMGKEWGNNRDIILWQIEAANKKIQTSEVLFLTGTNIRTQYKLSGLIQGEKI